MVHKIIIKKLIDATITMGASYLKKKERKAASTYFEELVRARNMI